MRYYSEDTVKRMLLRFAHTALEQRAINNGDVFFRQLSIEIPDKHGRLIDADKFYKRLVQDIKDLEGDEELFEDEYETMRTVYQSVLYELGEEPTILEATE